MSRSNDEVFAAYLRRQDLVSGGSVPPDWTSDGMALRLVKGAPEETMIFRVDLRTGKETPLFDVATVRAALAAATGHEPPYCGLPFDRIRDRKDHHIEFSYSGSNWRLDPATSELSRIRDLDVGAKFQGGVSEAEHMAPRMWKRVVGYLVDKSEVPEQLSPSGEWYASVQDDNVVLRSTRDGREQRLTSCGTPDVFWDIESSFPAPLQGRVGQIAFRTVDPWSPDSLTLLAYRRDIRGVFRIPRVHWLKPFEEVDFVPFQKAGARLDRVAPVFVDVRSGRQIPVALPDIEDRYIQLLTWHPGGAEALIVIYTRDLRRVDIVAADRQTGAVRPLMTESGPTAVKIQISEVFCYSHGFRLLPNGDGFLWLSTRDGWNHIYLYDWNGSQALQLTRGAWSVYEIEHVDVDGFVYFLAAIDTARPYDLHVCRVPVGGGRIAQLTHERGIHTPAFAPGGGRAFLDTHSAVDRPPRTDLVKTDGTHVRVLAETDISRLVAIGYTPAEEFTVKAADGTTELWGVMYRPFNFDPHCRYPVIEYIYGGPQTIWAQRFFAINQTKFANLAWALSHLGYITLCLDARGTPGRSKSFQDVVHGNFTAGVADHAAAIRQLCERNSWMDANRVGIYGASWGGYFSACALMHAPDTYHAAVSAEPNYDPWSAMAYEPYLGMPQHNRAAYDQADLIQQAAKITRPLMIVNGTRYNPTTSTAFKMTRALIDAGVDHELVIMPDASHAFVGAEEEYFLMKTVGWFDRHVRNRPAEV